MFKLDDSGEASGGTITAREILDQAVADTSTNMARDPDAQSQVMHLIARAYFNLGLLNRANQAAHTALETRRMLHGPDDPSTLESMAQMGWILGFQGQSAEAQRMERDALSRELRVLGPENAQTLETMHKLAVIDGTVGDHAEEQKLRHEIEVIRARLADSRMGGR
jgi:hypothetical protein